MGAHVSAVSASVLCAAVACELALLPARARSLVDDTAASVLNEARGWQLDTAAARHYQVQLLLVGSLVFITCCACSAAILWRQRSGRAHMAGPWLAATAAYGAVRFASHAAFASADSRGAEFWSSVAVTGAALAIMLWVVAVPAPQPAPARQHWSVTCALALNLAVEGPMCVAFAARVPAAQTLVRVVSSAAGSHGAASTAVLMAAAPAVIAVTSWAALLAGVHGTGGGSVSVPALACATVFHVLLAAVQADAVKQSGLPRAPGALSTAVHIVLAVATVFGVSNTHTDAAGRAPRPEKTEREKR